MNQKPIFLVFTDSVALPRNFETGIVKWHESYIAKLKSSYSDFEVINVSIGGASIKDLRNQLNYYKILNPQVVLLQCGIVDASPRAFGRLEMELIKKLKLYRLTKPFVSFLRKYRAHHYASPKEFEQKILDFKQALNAKRFLSLGIIPSCSGYESILPGVSKSIDQYNSILKKYADEYISLDEIPRDGVLNDHHHINAIGHQFIFEQLQKKL